MENENKEQRFLTVDPKLERMPPIPQLTRLDLFEKIAELKAQITKLNLENLAQSDLIFKLETENTKLRAGIKVMKTLF